MQPLQPLRALLQLVAEVLKTMLVALTSACHQDQQQQAVLQLLVPLLVEAASPVCAPAPSLTDMAVKLVTHLASGPAAPAFKAVVASLPVSTKQRLQVRDVGKA